MYTRFFKQILIISFVVLSACSSQGVKALSGHWQLSESNLNGSLLKKDDLKNTQFTIRFDNESKISGMSACNRWSSTYVISNSKLNTKPASLTRKRCHHKSDAIGALYRQYPNALTKPADVSHNGSVLQLKWSDGNYWIFKAVE